MFGHDNHDDNDQSHGDHHDPGPVTDNPEPEHLDGARPSDWQPPTDSEDHQNDHSHHQVSDDHGDDASASEDFGAEASHPADAPTAGGSDELLDIKQEALSKLSPLVGHLDQTPDEKFRTLMMMIQASDDESLLRLAYETALHIDDEKSRAQALLDIVNEINYFTQNPPQG